MQNHDLLCSLVDCCVSMKRMCVDGRDGKLPPPHEGIQNSWLGTNSLFEEDRILSVVQNARTLLCNSWSLEIVLALFLIATMKYSQSVFKKEEQGGICTPLGKVCFRKCFLDDFLESSLLTYHWSATLRILFNCPYGCDVERRKDRRNPNTYPFDDCGTTNRIPRTEVERIESFFFRNVFKESPAVVNIIPIAYPMANTILVPDCTFPLLEIQ